METRFIYKHEKEWVKRWDTGWKTMTMLKSANNTNSTAYGNDAQEPIRMLKTMDLSRWLPINQEYEFTQDPLTSNIALIGFVPQFVVMIYTGSRDTAPDCDFAMDIYFKDA